MPTCLGCAAVMAAPSDTHQNGRVKWLEAAFAARPVPTFLGLETSAWTVIVAAFSVLVAAASAFLAWRSSKRADKREHHRWLQEKRREAYVTFLTATRDTYDVIEKRGRLSSAPRVTEDVQDPDSPKLRKHRTAIDQNFGKVKRAKDILAVVGPKEMEELGDAVMARLSLDRIYYSPTGWSQRDNDRERILRYAGATGISAFHAAMRNVYDDQGHADFEAYNAAHHEHRLDNSWASFTERARRILGDAKPNRQPE